MNKEKIKNIIIIVLICLLVLVTTLFIISKKDENKSNEVTVTVEAVGKKYLLGSSKNKDYLITNYKGDYKEKDKIKFTYKNKDKKEKDEDLKTQEVQCFLKSHGFLKTNDPNILFSKTLKAYLITTEAKLSKQYLKFSPTLGIAYNGNYLILSSSEYLKTGKECTLLDVMEKNVPEKYFLSPEAIQKIIAKSE